MKNARLTFNSSTNFTLPIGAYYVLQYDALMYGYVKNQKPNISGFLNELIPSLSDYQEELRKELLKYNNGNEEIAKAAARSIYHVYLSPFAFHDDGSTNIPFRISKDKYEDFITIHDERLFFYDTDFTSYIRTLIVEYASKTFSQREYLYAFRNVEKLKKAIADGLFCRIYYAQKNAKVLPISIEQSPVSDHNYIVGFTYDLAPILIKLCEVNRIEILEEKGKSTEKMCEAAIDALQARFDEETEELHGEKEELQEEEDDGCSE